MRSAVSHWTSWPSVAGLALGLLLVASSFVMRAYLDSARTARVARAYLLRAAAYDKIYAEELMTAQVAYDQAEAVAKAKMAADKKRWDEAAARAKREIGSGLGRLGDVLQRTRELSGLDADPNPPKSGKRFSLWDDALPYPSETAEERAKARSGWKPNPQEVMKQQAALLSAEKAVARAESLGVALGVAWAGVVVWMVTVANAIRRTAALKAVSNRAPSPGE